MDENQKHWKSNHLQALEKLGFKASQFNRLRQLENIANYWATQYCNGDIDGDTWEVVKFDIERAIKRLHGGTLPNGFFVNGDPRGYALKIDMESLEYGFRMSLGGIHTDWGGYAILAPEF